MCMCICDQLINIYCQHTNAKRTNPFLINVWFSDVAIETTYILTMTKYITTKNSSVKTTHGNTINGCKLSSTMAYYSSKPILAFITSYINYWRVSHNDIIKGGMFGNSIFGVLFVPWLNNLKTGDLTTCLTTDAWELKSTHHWLRNNALQGFLIGHIMAQISTLWQIWEFLR